MFAPEKIAWLIFKILAAMTIFSLLLGVGNVVPYYMRMHETANDLILRASVNNYLLQEQVDDIIDSNFGEGLFSSLTFKGEGESQYGDASDSIFVYARTAPFEMDLFESSTCNTGEYCPAYVSGRDSPSAVFNKTTSWDPKNNPADMMEFNSAGGAQRGDTMGIRLDAKVRVNVVIAGGNIEFGIPLAVEKYGPAMHYYRGR